MTEDQDFRSDILDLLNARFGNNWKKITLVMSKDPYLSFTYEVKE